jgi:predicted nuclease of predicted toxin-antitoxin system
LLLLIDESLPKRLTRYLPEFEAWTVQQRRWSRTKDGALLRLAESAGFQVFLTADQNLQYQQNLAGSQIRIVVFAAPSNRLEHIRPLLPRAIAALREMTPGEVRVIPWT